MERISLDKLPFQVHRDKQLLERCLLARFMGRADSKYQLGFSCGCRIAIARSALMSCITAYRPSRIELFGSGLLNDLVRKHN